MSITEITTAEGRMFRMRVVNAGDGYGSEMCLVHDDDRTLVEFYDANHEFETDPDGAMLGQFVSRYFLETLLGQGIGGGQSIFAAGQGLNLDGGVPAWRLDAKALTEAEIALFEAGLVDRPVSPGLAFGYAAFRSETPDRQLDPYPSVTPHTPSSRDAQGWATAYHLVADRDVLERSCREDAEEFGLEEEEIDDVFPVIVTDDGQIRVYHESPRYLLAAHAGEDVLAAHGVEPCEDETPGLP